MLPFCLKAMGLQPERDCAPGCFLTQVRAFRDLPIVPLSSIQLVITGQR